MKIKIELDLDSTNRADVSVLTALTNALNAGKVVALQPTAVEEDTAKKTPTKKTPTRKAPAKKATGVVQSEDDESLEEITLDVLRSLIAKKVDANRAAMRAQFKKLGAANVGKLDPSQYQELYDFLKALKDSE